MRILSMALALALLGTAGAASAQSQTDDLNIQLELVNECYMIVEDYSGNMTGLTPTQNSAGRNISVMCNLDTPYTVEIAQGANFGLGSRAGTRALSDGTGNFISYDVWSGGGYTVPWATGSDAVAGVGTGAFTAHAYNLSFYDGNLAPGGIYADNALVTLTYN